MKKQQYTVQALKQQLYTLFANGYTKQDASAIVGITPKTAGVWIKQYTKALTDLQTIKNNILVRMAKETASPDIPTAEIHNLSIALSVIDKQIKAIQNS